MATRLLTFHRFTGTASCAIELPDDLTWEDVRTFSTPSGLLQLTLRDGRTLTQPLGIKWDSYPEQMTVQDATTQTLLATQ